MRKFVAWGLYARHPTDFNRRQQIGLWVFLGIPFVIGAFFVIPFTHDIGIDILDGSRKSWTEDVRLTDGSVVTVKRFVRLRTAGSSMAGGEYDVERESRMTFNGPDAGLPEWDFPLMALVLYRDKSNGEWTVVATSKSCEIISERAQPRLMFMPDRPATIYFEFRARHNQWTQVPLSRQSLGYSSNLLFWYWALDSKHISVAEKDTFWRTKGFATWKPYVTILETYERGLGCGPTNFTRPIHQAEDEVMTALEREGASQEQRERVEELLAGTRLLHVHGIESGDWHPDSDPMTVQTVDSTFLNSRKPGVSADGQVIFVGVGRGMMDDEFWQMKESYARRLESAGLGKFAPQPDVTRQATP